MWRLRFPCTFLASFRLSIGTTLTIASCLPSRAVDNLALHQHVLTKPDSRGFLPFRNPSHKRLALSEPGVQKAAGWTVLERRPLQEIRHRKTCLVPTVCNMSAIRRLAPMSSPPICSPHPVRPPRQRPPCLALLRRPASPAPDIPLLLAQAGPEPEAQRPADS